jgi:hypothetical protein
MQIRGVKTGHSNVPNVGPRAAWFSEEGVEEIE